jgi:hypothetical protein
MFATTLNRVGDPVDRLVHGILILSSPAICRVPSAKTTKDAVGRRIPEAARTAAGREFNGASF